MSMHKGRTCPYCLQILANADEVYMVSLEKPYMNLFFHKDHYFAIKDSLYQFLTENLNNWYNIKDNYKKEK
jgi:hypothetical protein